MVGLLALLFAVFVGISIASVAPPLLLAILKHLFRCPDSSSSGSSHEKLCQHNLPSSPIVDDGSNEIVEEKDSSPPLPSSSNAVSKPDPFDPSKRNGYLSWDDYFMAIAFLSAHRSKDPNRQVGACLVSQDRVILGIGYNGFPRGCSDDELPWAKLSVDGDPLQTKYPEAHLSVFMQVCVPCGSKCHPEQKSRFSSGPASLCHNVPM